MLCFAVCCNVITCYRENFFIGQENNSLQGKKMSAGERLKEARNKLRLSQAELGVPFEYAYSKVRDMESGKQKITMEIAAGFEDKFSISSSWLLSGTGEMFLPLSSDSFPASTGDPVGSDDLLNRGMADMQTKGVAGGMVRIPVYDARGDCGPGAINYHDQVDTWMSFTPEFARATFGTVGKGLKSLRASGNSMVPTINEGDMVVLDSSETTLTRDGSIYVLQMGGTTVVKRLQRLPGNIVRVASDNAAGWSKDMSENEIEAEGLRIVGRVVFVGRLT